MAGGIGSRFWPMSTPEYPKQFVDVMGCGKTMIQMTVERFAPICPMKNFWIVTSASYVPIVRKQLPEIPVENILAEPCARNTAPCIAYACWKIKAKHPSANIVVTPSDAFVPDKKAFAKTIKAALHFTEQKESIVCLGIHPTFPSCEYGYIQEIPGNIFQEEGEFIRKVDSFKEKPHTELAQSYLEQGGYWWNAGIFVWSVAFIEKQLRRYAPQIEEVMDLIEPALYERNEQEMLEEYFPTCEKISIDYAIMEKADEIYVFPANFGWSDLGTWGSLHNNTQHDAHNNSLIGENIHMYESRNCIVHTTQEKKVVVQGLDGYIVAEKDNTLLICRLTEEQRIKEFSE